MTAIELRPGLVLFLCLLCYVSRWSSVLAFLTAAVFHELGHAAAIYLCGVQVKTVRLGAREAVLAAGPLSDGKELLCALAGPLCSFLLAPFGIWWPELGLFALGQGFYNLLPIYPMDGGRGLFCGLRLWLPEEMAWRITCMIGSVFGALLAAAGIYGALFRRWGLAAVTFSGILFFRVLELWRDP